MRLYQKIIHEEWGRLRGEKCLNLTNETSETQFKMGLK